MTTEEEVRKYLTQQTPATQATIDKIVITSLAVAVQNQNNLFHSMKEQLRDKNNKIFSLETKVYNLEHEIHEDGFLGDQNAKT